MGFLEILLIYFNTDRTPEPRTTKSNLVDSQSRFIAERINRLDNRTTSCNLEATTTITD